MNYHGGVVTNTWGENAMGSSGHSLIQDTFVKTV